MSQSKEGSPNGREKSDPIDLDQFLNKWYVLTDKGEEIFPHAAISIAIKSDSPHQLIKRRKEAFGIKSLMPSTIRKPGAETLTPAKESAVYYSKCDAFRLLEALKEAGKLKTYLNTLDLNSW